MFNRFSKKALSVLAALLPILGLLKYGAVTHLIKAHIAATYLVLVVTTLLTLRSLLLTRTTLLLLLLFALYFYSDALGHLHPSLTLPPFTSY